MSCRPLFATLSVVAACFAPHLSQAQVTLKPDGQWRYLLTAGANVSSGNNDARSLNISGEAARQTVDDKWIWNARADQARNAGVSTTDRYVLRTQYDRNISPDWFGFGSGETLRDQLANIDARYSVASGVGRHVWRTERGYFDVSTGLGYTYDRYVTSRDIAGAMRDRYGRLELVLAEESSHKLTDTTRLRQKFTLLPNLRDSGKYRAVLDTGLTVAMTPTINLSAGLSYRYDSDPGAGLEKVDAMFVTGVSLRFD
jgi:putative salt-induced outer membrane protein YdiY